jgi:hypothetical protein
MFTITAACAQLQHCVRELVLPLSKMAVGLLFLLTAGVLLAEESAAAESTTNQRLADVAVNFVFPESRMHAAAESSSGVPSSEIYVPDGGSVLLDCDTPGWSYCR